MSKIKLAIVGFVLVCATMIVAAATFDDDSERSIRSNVLASTVWNESTFWERMNSRRRRITARGGRINTGIVHENRIILGSVSNSSNVTIEKIFTETERVGHEVSTRAKARSVHFEVEIGYTFSYETISTRTTRIIIHPFTSVEVWESDIRVSRQWISVRVQRQHFLLFRWRDAPLARWFESEVIREFSGNHIEIIDIS